MGLELIFTRNPEHYVAAGDPRMFITYREGEYGMGWRPHFLLFKGDRKHRFSEIDGRMFMLFAICFPHTAPYERMSEHIWGDREDGGPLDIPKNMHVHAFRIRRVLPQFGLQLVLDWGIGYRLISLKKD
jgi:hypothetical protein